MLLLGLVGSDEPRGNDSDASLALAEKALQWSLVDISGDAHAAWKSAIRLMAYEEQQAWKRVLEIRATRTPERGLGPCGHPGRCRFRFGGDSTTSCCGPVDGHRSAWRWAEWSEVEQSWQRGLSADGDGKSVCKNLFGQLVRRSVSVSIIDPYIAHEAERVNVLTDTSIGWLIEQSAELADVAPREVRIYVEAPSNKVQKFGVSIQDVLDKVGAPDCAVRLYALPDRGSRTLHDHFIIFTLEEGASAAVAVQLGKGMFQFDGSGKGHAVSVVGVSLAMGEVRRAERLIKGEFQTYRSRFDRNAPEEEWEAMDE